MELRIKKAIVVAAAALALPVATLIPATSQAAMITNWDYTVTSYFTHWTDSNGGSDGSGNVQGLDGNTKLQWGSNDLKGDRISYISVEGTVTNPPTLETNGNSVDGAKLTHNNGTISNDVATLSTATLYSELTLNSTSPTGVTEGPIPLQFGISFKETDNSQPLNDCPGQVSNTPCDDIFVLDTVNGEPPTDTITAPTFTIDGWVYTVSLNVDGLGPLVDDACIAAGADPGCYGLVTEEKAVSSFHTSFKITAIRAVPEPGTLSILGLGLLCLAWAGYSRKRRIG